MSPKDFAYPDSKLIIIQCNYVLLKTKKAEEFPGGSVGQESDFITYVVWVTGHEHRKKKQNRNKILDMCFQFSFHQGINGR